MSLTVVSGQYADLRDRWSALSRAVDAPPFSTPEFGEAWWSVFGGSGAGDLELLGLENGSGELVGLAPLRRCGTHWMFAGDHEVSDYLGPVARDGQEPALVSAVLDRLEASEAHSAEFRGIEPESSWVEAFAAANNRGWRVDVEEEAVCPTVQIGDGWEGYLAALRPRDRREVRRKLRPLRQLRALLSLRPWRPRQTWRHGCRTSCR